MRAVWRGAVRPAAIESDVLSQRTPRVKNQQIAQIAACVPPNGPGIIFPGNLVLQHLRKTHGAVEIESVQKLALFKFSEQSARIRIVERPAVPPGGPAPAIGTTDKISIRECL